MKSGQYYDLLRRGFIKEEDTEPESAGFEFYFDAFDELSTARQVGMGLGPIPFTAIAEYFRMYEISAFESFDDFSFVIRRMDKVFLELNSADPKKPSGGTSGKSDNDKNPPDRDGHKRSAGPKGRR